ncbi:MAG: aminotransferase class V-fold PLP-dependent enzyme, partial [Gemmatimonadetes bacterium]|nr:aminotransferase class V-fold PLP-dependent enzyme [Gemmatimonadota bacterium]
GVDEQFAFDPKRFRLRSDARRFEMGTPALAAVYTASAGLEIIEEVGLSVIRERIAGLVADLVERARAAGLEARVAPRPEDRSGIVRIEHRDPAGVVQHLMARSIICDHRLGAVRISPHFYNTTEDSEAVVAALSRL